MFLDAALRAGYAQKNSAELVFCANAGSQNAAEGRWYVVRTQPHAEARVISNLERHAYRVFCPYARKTVRHARKKNERSRPLVSKLSVCPARVFTRSVAQHERHPWRCAHDHARRDAAIRGARDRRRLAGLQAWTRADGAMDWTSTFKSGQAVRIAAGPFSDIVGTLEHLDAVGRVRVMLDLLGRSVPVALHCEALTPAA